MNYKYFLLSLLFISCAKEDNLEKLLPSVSVVSATPKPDGTIDLRARVSSTVEDLIIAGFCADSAADPNIEVNQILVSSVVDNEISATLYPFGIQSQEGVVVVNTFAGNDFGLGKGQPLVISGLNEIYNYPQLRPDCFYPSNSFSIANGVEGDFTVISNPYNPPATFGFRVDAQSDSGVQISVTFLELVTGRFSLVPEQFSYGDNELTIEVLLEGESFELQGEEAVVVSQLNENDFRITICNAPLFDFSDTGRRFSATIDVIV